MIALKVCLSPEDVNEHIEQSRREAQVEEEDLGAAPRAGAIFAAAGWALMADRAEVGQSVRKPLVQTLGPKSAAARRPLGSSVQTLSARSVALSDLRDGGHF